MWFTQNFILSPGRGPWRGTPCYTPPPNPPPIPPAATHPTTLAALLVWLPLLAAQPHPYTLAGVCVCGAHPLLVRAQPCCTPPPSVPHARTAVPHAAPAALHHHHVAADGTHIGGGGWGGVPGAKLAAP